MRVRLAGRRPASADAAAPLRGARLRGVHMRHPLSIPGWPRLPQPPGHGTGRRASGTTQRERCPGGEDLPPTVSFRAPPARPSEAPAREAIR